MDDKLARLHAILQKQRDVLSDMVETAEGQRRALLDQNREMVAETTEKQETLFAHLQSLEFDRMQLLQALGIDAESEAAGAEFERFLRSLPVATGQTLFAVRDEARNLLLKLQAVNGTNQELLAQEVVMFDLYMSVLHPDLSAEVYSEPGQTRPGPGTGAVAFDTKA